MGQSTVKRRCVFALAGYEPAPPERQFERFVRELRRFDRTWNVTTTVSDMTLSQDRIVSSWQMQTRGPNWEVHTDFHTLRWDDFVAEDFERTDIIRIPRGFVTFGDFILSGTAWRYFQTNWRYGLFFLYPLLILIAFAVLAIFAGRFAASFDLPSPLITASLIALAVWIALIYFVGSLFLLRYIFDDWIFAREFVHRSRAGLSERLESVSREIAKVLQANSQAGGQEGGYDEIVISAHSLGNAWQIAAVDRALALARQFGADGQRLCLLSTGSSLLKIALHPKADWLRQAVLRVARSPAVFWVEYQALADVISFYKTNPVTALTGEKSDIPRMRNLRIRHMLDDAIYRRLRGNFFRLHRQLTMGNDKRYFYDFYMICCGPFRLQTRVEDAELMMKAFASDGSLLEPSTVGAAS